LENVNWNIARYWIPLSTRHDRLGFHIFEYSVNLFNNAEADSFATFTGLAADEDSDSLDEDASAGSGARKRGEARGGRSDGLLEDDRVVYKAAEDAVKFNTPCMMRNIYFISFLSFHSHFFWILLFH
jgi:hypothetical protein